MGKKSSLNELQLKTLSSLLVDLGKLFFAAGVIGFLFPGLTDKISWSSFLFSLLVSGILFYIGISILNKLSKEKL